MLQMGKPLLRGIVLKGILALSLLLCLFILPPCLGAGNFPSSLPVVEREQREILRFHVRADSNSSCDQQVKNAVAAAILQRFAPAWYVCSDREELNHMLAQDLDAMGETARAILRDQGFEQEVAVQLGKSTFPARLYEGKYYPPGEYDSLVVVIGTGRGENWWCVIFPPLCFNVLPAPSDILHGSTGMGERGFEHGAEDKKPCCQADLEKREGEEKKWRFWLVEYFLGN